jgi:hypothetical protein
MDRRDCTVSDPALLGLAGGSREARKGMVRELQSHTGRRVSASAAAGESRQYKHTDSPQGTPRPISKSRN